MMGYGAAGVAILIFVQALTGCASFRSDQNPDLVSQEDKQDDTAAIAKINSDIEALRRNVLQALDDYKKRRNETKESRHKESSSDNEALASYLDALRILREQLTISATNQIPIVLESIETLLSDIMLDEQQASKNELLAYLGKIHFRYEEFRIDITNLSRIIGDRILQLISTAPVEYVDFDDSIKRLRSFPFPDLTDYAAFPITERQSSP